MACALLVRPPRDGPPSPQKALQGKKLEEGFAMLFSSSKSTSLSFVVVKRQGVIMNVVDTN